MQAKTLHTYSAAAQEALATYLKTLLGEEAALAAEPPVPDTGEAVQPQTTAYVVVRDAEAGFALLLDPNWVALISQAMLGEAMPLDDPGTTDLIQEVTMQGYGAVRTRLSADDVSLPPDPSFAIHLPDQSLDDLPADVWRIDFQATINAEALGGMVLLAASGDEATASPGTPKAPHAEPASSPDPGPPSYSGNLALLAGVELEVSVELGRCKLPLADMLRLSTGSLIELKKPAGDPLEIYANDRLVAEGEAVVIAEQFGIRITRLASARERSAAR